MYSLAHYYGMKVQTAPGYHAKPRSRMLSLFCHLFQSPRLSLSFKLLLDCRAALRQFSTSARSFASCSASGTTVSSALTVRFPEGDLLGAAIYFRNKEAIMLEGLTACRFETFCMLKSTLDEMRE
jgi:hypothetical protein